MKTGLIPSEVAVRVITLEGFPDSVEVGLRAKRSAISLGFSNSELSWARVPGTKTSQFLKSYSIAVDAIQKSRFSRPDRAIACFASHFELWLEASERQSPTMILEHDAILRSKRFLSRIRPESGLISLGKPSYGRSRWPKKWGAQPLFSKHHLPGAHAYIVFPWAARQLVGSAMNGSVEPTDVYLSLRRFSWLHEYFPWPATAEETFSTVQDSPGLVGKRKLTRDYRLV